MPNSEIKQNVLNQLKSLSVCIPDTMERQWYVRCPYCGDSRDKSHGHLSIKIDLSTDEPMVWRCLKCGECGIVTETLLRDLGVIIDSEIRSSLKSFNKRSSRYNKFLNDYIEKIEIPNYTSNLAISHLSYINQRIGGDLTLSDAKKYSLILDLQEFLSANGLSKIYNISEKMQWFISQNYVGFLSTSKNKIIFRLCSDIPSAKRYLKYPLNPFNSNPASFYNIPTEFDIMSPDDLHVHIAEGTFDIISIERNLFRNKNKNRNLFFASCGFGPMTIIQYLVYFGAGGSIILHIYCDNDKTDIEEIKNMKIRKEMFPWIKEIWFHRNRIEPYEKDYGVPLNRIYDEQRKVIL